MKKKRIILSVFAVLILVTTWIVWGNTAVELNTETVLSKKLPESFDGFRIVQISDLHNAQFGEGNGKLLSLIETANPDLIAITGDLIDSRKTDLEVALQFAEKAVRIAPCYYVTGNHEARIAECETLKSELCNLGVVVLENLAVGIEKNGEVISLVGVEDPSFETDYLFGDANAVMSEQLNALATNEWFTVLLSHRPELFSCYAEHEIDLVLSGHAHGGQFRLPFVGGLIAPNQGLFPQYDAGRFEENGTTMIISRGIGNSILPFRINNRPEVVLIELKRG